MATFSYIGSDNQRSSDGMRWEGQKLVNAGWDDSPFVPADKMRLALRSEADSKLNEYIIPDGLGLRFFNGNDAFIHCPGQSRRF